MFRGVRVSRRLCRSQKQLDFDATGRIGATDGPGCTQRAKSSGCNSGNVSRVALASPPSPSHTPPDRQNVSSMSHDQRRRGFVSQRAPAAAVVPEPEM